jgi:multidrug efflux pump subunit AcrB
MGPIPINASIGMLLSLAVAFVVTPWLARRWLPAKPVLHDSLAQRLAPLFRRIFRPFLDPLRGSRWRLGLVVAIAALLALSLGLPLVGWVQLKMLPFDNKSELQVLVDMPAGTPVEATAAVLHEMGSYLAGVPEVVDYQAYAGTASPINFNGLVRQYYLRSGGEVGDIQVNLLDKHRRRTQSHAIAVRLRPALQAIGLRHGARVKVVEVPPGPPVLAPIVAEVYGPTADGRRLLADRIRRVFERQPGVVDVDVSSIADAPRKLLLVDRRKAALAGVSQAAIVDTLSGAFAGDLAIYLHDQSKYPVPARLALAEADAGNTEALLQLGVRALDGRIVPVRDLVSVVDTVREQPSFHKDGLPVSYVVGDTAGKLDSPLYGLFSVRPAVLALAAPGGAALQEYFVRQPDEAYRQFSVKWDGEWQITYETFRDMGTAYAVGLVLIYLLVVAQFGSYLTPLIIMAPIPLTLAGVMPGHALLGAQFTATSMIGMIALAGIIVRNSILLVDVIEQAIQGGADLAKAVVDAVVTRAQPIALTGLAAMLGATFILDDPIFNGLAISLIFGILVSTLLTLLVIPLLYYVAYRRKFPAAI